jgi:hypothetical protein
MAFCYIGEVEVDMYIGTLGYCVDKRSFIQTSVLEWFDYHVMWRGYLAEGHAYRVLRTS